MRKPHIEVPEVVRLKPGALNRIGLYLARPAWTRSVLLHSEGLLQPILDSALTSLHEYGIELAMHSDVTEASVENAVHLLGSLPRGTQVIVGLGGGKALDVAKYVASLAGLPYFAVPTSLSNDGFCSPQASLTLRNSRKSLPTGLPHAVIVDLEVCSQAPVQLWHSGVGDLTSKLTAVLDWKLAFHRVNTPVNDLAALLSDATVYQFMANPTRDEEGIRLLATALMLNGVSMEIAGSSRPASGSEHLISHALDFIGARAVLHGIQTGTAAYIVSRFQGGSHHDRIAALFQQTGFWQSVHARPFSIAEWRHAFELAPGIKDGYYTILSERDWWPEVEQMIGTDENLRSAFN
jgi:glycerol-1-phosphate dehydrogenase [NAD(P)+]